MIGKTEIRPGQLTSMSTPCRRPYWARKSIASSRSASSDQRPARQQLEAPADDGAGEDREAVDERVQQRPHAAVLAGDAGEEAVEVVAGGDRPEDDRGGGGACRRRLEGEDEEERQRRQPDVADQVGDRPGVERLALAGLRCGFGPLRSSPKRRRTRPRPKGAAARHRALGEAPAPARRPPPRAARARRRRHARWPRRRRRRGRGGRRRSAAGSRAARRRSASRPPRPRARRRGPRSRPRAAPRRACRRPRARARRPWRGRRGGPARARSPAGQTMPRSSAPLLDRGGDDPRRADPVAAHHDRPLRPVLVEVGGAERLRVAGAELEDVADLDRRLDLDRAAAGGGVAGLDRAHVELLELEVAAGLDPAQVGVGLGWRRRRRSRRRSPRP